MLKSKKKQKDAVDSAVSRNHRLIRDRRKKRLQKAKEVSVEDVVEKYAKLAKSDSRKLEKFTDFPLSDRTLRGLQEADYTIPTDIQRDSLPFSLTGSDVVAAAKTGSGKTLALVIPVLECLWRERWSRKTDGLGTIIISPTRELALQTFNVINKIGKYHDVSCALLIGGTDVKYEMRRLATVNIIICTPGRLQQHLDENDAFRCETLRMLVIDEADRILDMGFAPQVNAIVSCLPSERQTLLFSATQTKDVKQLCRVCTNEALFISVHEKSDEATPQNLQQSYLVCKEEEKLNLVWSFITMHKHLKILVFVSSCKQARFLTECFCHLRPGTSLMGLWGTMKQTKRLKVFETFEKRKSACLVTTDVAARGLDFSSLHWVLQMDAPASVDDYIHRVGRTARMGRKGQALLLLSPVQEKSMVQLLQERKIPVQRVAADTANIVDIHKKMQSVLAQFPELNELGQKYVVAYLRSVYVMRDKRVFDVHSIDAQALAESLGLAAIKRIRFLRKRKEGKKVVVKEQQVFEGRAFGDWEDESEQLFTLKKADVFGVQQMEEKDEEQVVPVKRDKVLTKMKEAKKLLKRGFAVNSKVVFDEEGEVKERVADGGKSEGLHIPTAMEHMMEQDQKDKASWRERERERKRAKKRKEKERKRKEREDDAVDLTASSDEQEEEVDLSWLPDPDKEEGVRPKRRRRTSREEDERRAFSLLTA